MLYRFEHRVLADALGTAQQQCMIDLFLRALHPVGKPWQDMIGIVGIDFVNVIKPRARFGRVARFDCWGQI